MAVAVCLPLTYSLGLENGLGLLLGLYVGGISGGLVPAILLGIPGTPSSITTCFDGYPMAQRGEGEKALRIGIISSLVGGLISLAALFLFAPALADFAIKFSHVEKFLIILFALTVTSLPHLLDKEVDFVTAMLMSFQVVMNNFPVMILWAAIVAVGTLLAMIPAFLGLFIALPVFGHATWHLYRRALIDAG